MYFQFLIEDMSSAELVKILMDKIAEKSQKIEYDCKYFHGLGGFTKKNTVKETKTGKLLNDLATYLKGFSKSLQSIQAAIIVVLDNDDRDTNKFQRQLREIAEQNEIKTDHVFCVAVEEVEAWLLGDEEAVKAAYPSAKLQVLHSYVQDSICGTWEILADAVYPGGLAKFRKNCPTYVDVGKYKTIWAKEIGIHMDISKNKSPSFQTFILEIQKRLPA